MPISWPEVHGALTHFPVALLITACVFEIAALLARWPTGRSISFWLLVAVVVTAAPTLLTGWMSGHELFGGAVAVPGIFLRHRAAAFLAAGLALLLLVWRGVVHDQLSGGPLIASLLLLLVAGVAVGYAGYLGGIMVFRGVPAGIANAPTTLPSSASSGAGPGTSGSAPTGRQLFLQYCARCHGSQGEGKFGPRLAGSSLSTDAIRGMVINGSPPRMPAFGSRLSVRQILAVSAYVHSIAVKS